MPTRATGHPYPFRASRGKLIHSSLQDRDATKSGLRSRLLFAAPNGPRLTGKETVKAGSNVSGVGPSSQFTIDPARNFDAQGFAIAALIDFNNNAGNFRDVVALGYNNSSTDNWRARCGETSLNDEWKVEYTSNDTNDITKFNGTTPFTRWVMFQYDGANNEFSAFILTTSGTTHHSDTDTGLDKGSPNKPYEVTLRFGGPGHGCRVGYMFNGILSSTDRQWLVEHPYELIRPASVNPVVFEFPKAKGSITEGGESLAGSSWVVPFADGTLTEGGETLDGHAYYVPVADGSLTEGGETLSGSAWNVPYAEGTLTEGAETLSGSAWNVPYAEGTLTEGGETLDGSHWVVPYMEGGITEAKEELQGFTVNSVGDDKVMARSTTIGNVIPFLKKSLSVTNQLQGCDSARFMEMLGPNESPSFEVGEPIRIYSDERQDEAVFGGTIDRRTIEDLGASAGAEAGSRRVDYEAICFTQLAEKRVIAGTWENMTAGEIVRDIVSRTLSEDNVTTDGVEDGPTIEFLAVQYKRVSEVLNELSKRTGYSWYIDPYRDLQFFARDSNTAPWNITNSSQPFQKLTLKEGREKYRNRQFIRGGKQLTDVRTEEFIGDGRRRQFSVSFPIAKEPTVKVNGEVQEVGISGVDENKDWYWNKGERSTHQSEDKPILTNSDTVEIIYEGQVRLLMEKMDSAEVDTRADVEDGSGLYENITHNADIETRHQARDRLDELLRRFSEIRETLQFTTNKTGLEQGQILSVTVDDLNIDADYLIESVQYTVKDNDEFRMDVKALSGEPFGGWQEFFRHLILGRTDEISIGQDEDVILLRTPSEEVEIGETVQLQEVDKNSLAPAESVTTAHTVSMTTETQSLVIGSTNIGEKPID